ncbi:hypothetical protein BX666DRAFT_1929715 [Dichotomocladium elegans]|nr:hypothetical protein BX666DRAFT_1929715 [Dichotomocladium elegans]
MDYRDDTLPPRTVGQPWILLTMESPLNPEFRRDDVKMRQFEYLASYHLRSRFLFPYFSPNIMDTINRPLESNFMARKTADAPILWIASNCDAWNGRHHYVKELMKYIKVDSYGGCLNNKVYPENTERLALMGMYKFYLAIENSNCEDYVTEKLFDTFQASTVPIVDGPRSYTPFIPTQRSVIRMDAYPDPRELADYIQFLDKNDTAYLEYLSYRRDADSVPAVERVEAPFYTNWSSWELHNNRAYFCSICRGIAPWWRARHDENIELPNDMDAYLRTDLSCRTDKKWDYARKGPPYIPHWKPSLADEFTRPWVKKRIPLYSGNQVGEVSARSVWGVYLLLYLIFFTFIAILIRHRR